MRATLCRIPKGPILASGHYPLYILPFLAPSLLLFLGSSDLGEFNCSERILVASGMLSLFFSLSSFLWLGLGLDCTEEVYCISFPWLVNTCYVEDKRYMMWHPARSSWTVVIFVGRRVTSGCFYSSLTSPAYFGIVLCNVPSSINNIVMFKAMLLCMILSIS